MDIHLENGTMGRITIEEAHRIAHVINGMSSGTAALEYAKHMKHQAMQNLEHISHTKVMDEQSAKDALYAAGKLSAVDCEGVGELAEYLCARMIEHVLTKMTPSA